MGKLSHGRQKCEELEALWEVRRGLIDVWPTYDGNVKG